MMSFLRLFDIILGNFSGFSCSYCGNHKSKGVYYKINHLKFCKKVCLRKYSKENNIKCDHCNGILSDDFFLDDKDNLNFCSEDCCYSYYEEK